MDLSTFNTFKDPADSLYWHGQNVCGKCGKMNQTEQKKVVLNQSVYHVVSPLVNRYYWPLTISCFSKMFKSVFHFLLRGNLVSSSGLWDWSNPFNLIGWNGVHCWDHVFVFDTVCLSFVSLYLAVDSNWSSVNANEGGQIYLTPSPKM